MAVCFLKTSKRVSLSSLVRQNLIWCNLIMGVTSYYLCHILLVRASCSFHSAVKGRKLYKGVWLIEGHLTLYLPQKVCAQSNFGRSSDQSGFQVFKEQGLFECAVAAIRCRPTWLNGYPVFKLQTWYQIFLGESQFFRGLTVQLYLSMPQFLPLQNEDDSTPPPTKDHYED